MGILRKMCSIFHDDWCSKCQSQMSETGRKLYMLPMTVGHYISHKDANYYRNNLIRVEKKADIPTATYACGAISYWCTKCGHRAVKLSIFLPVRDVEKYEDTIYFENGELDELLNN